MSSDLSEEERKLISDFREEKKRKAAKKAQEIRDARPNEELTREELILRLKKMEGQEYIRRVRNGDLSWDPQDRDRIRAAYAFVGEECPVSDW